MTDIAALLAADGPLARALPGFMPRPAQLRMAAAVAEALATYGQLLVEAGTGTGKTFAYLVPAMLSGGRIIVSTGTRTLQDQLFARDVPLLAGAIGRGTRVALLKGRSNYLCRERLLRPQQALPFDAALGRSLPSVLAQWSDSTRTGDLAELPELPDNHPLRARITSTRDNCQGSRCAEFARCHVFAARRRAAEADLVVVNHHLLLADLALKEEGFGDLLPSADAVILDEAHQVPDLAAQFFGSQFGSRQVDTLLTDLRGALIGAGHDGRRLMVGSESVLRAQQGVLELLSSRHLPNGRQSWDAADSALDVAVTVLSDALLALSEQAAALQGGEALQQCTERLVRQRDALETIATAASDEGARLVEATPRGFSLQLLPFDVGPRFRQLALSRRCAWVFTSATLTVGDGFSHFSSRLGLAEEAATLCIDSPFDYARQARLLLPRAFPDPGDPRHGEAVVDLALRLIEASGGGAFLLFTSLRALERAAQALRQRWSAASNSATAPRTMLVQGEAPRESLLSRFRDDGDAVLLGCASFWEGVDVKGDALRLVIIDKLPFSPPDDPLTKARLDHLRSTGGNPFAEHQLPEAALALKQGVGRLVRSEDDRGVVVICDSRMSSRGYGRHLLAALPPMTVIRDLAEAQAFLRALRPGAPPVAQS